MYLLFIHVVVSQYSFEASADRILASARTAFYLKNDVSIKPRYKFLGHNILTSPVRNDQSINRHDVVDFSLKVVQAIRGHVPKVKLGNPQRLAFCLLCANLLFETIRFQEASDLMHYETQEMKRIPDDYAKLIYAVHSQVGSKDIQDMLSRSPPKQDLLQTFSFSGL